MAIPVLAALGAAAAAKTLGGAVGGAGQYNDIQKGMNANKTYYNEGADILKAGKSGSNAAYSPYTQAGSTGAAGATNAVQNYAANASKGMADLNANKTTAGGTQAFLDPSANYSANQANKTTTASAIARGAAGGGLAKALSNNANKMAMTNWNTAYQQQLAANNQNFNQANTNWQNNATVQQNNVGNWQNLANMGLTATQGNQANQLAYNQNLNANRMGLGDNMMSGWNAKGKVFNDTSTGIGDNISGGISSMFGGGKK